MKSSIPTPNAPRTSPDSATMKAIGLLHDAKAAVGEIVDARRREKLSLTRTTHVAREIGEIIKVLSLYLPDER